MRFVQRLPHVNDASSGWVLDMQKLFQVPSAVINILYQRGYQTEGALHQLFYGSNSFYHDAYLLPDIEIAVERIRKAKDNGEKVAVWGDYDVDGVTATVIMKNALEQCGLTPLLWIPERVAEGYGLSEYGIDELRKHGTSLIVTVDCGIQDVALIEYAKARRIEIIVTDHHEPGEVLPRALAVIDPKRKDSQYPFREISGAVVAGKLAEALCGELFFIFHRDLMALSTIADVMPLVDENRQIVRDGLSDLAKYDRPGITALIEALNEEGSKVELDSLSTEDVAFGIAPVINAGGRMWHNIHAVELLSAREQNSNLKVIATKLCSLNAERKAQETVMFDEAVNNLGRGKSGRFVFAVGANWNQGIVGIVASRLAERYHLPALVFSYDETTELCKGSGRTIKGVSLFKHVQAAADEAVSCGGHDSAAGFTVSKDRFRAFLVKFDASISNEQEALFEPVMEYDTAVSVGELNKDLLRVLSCFEPCGANNPKPVFLLNNVSLDRVSCVGNGKAHFSATISDGKDAVRAIAFFKSPPEDTSNIDLLVTLHNNEFRGAMSLQARIEAIGDTQKTSSHDDVIYGAWPKSVSLSDMDVYTKHIPKYENKGIASNLDILSSLPTKYNDFREHVRPSAAVDKSVVAMIGRVKSVHNMSSGKGIFLVCVSPYAKDESFLAMFFHQDHLVKKIEIGQTYVFCGPVSVDDDKGEKRVTITPTKFGANKDKMLRLMPTHRKIRGISVDYHEATVKKSLDTLDLVDPLPKSVVREMGLMSLPEAYKAIHFPSSENDVERASMRFVFDRLHRLNWRMRHQHTYPAKDKQLAYKQTAIVKEFVDSLPFKLTDDQKKAIVDMVRQFQAGERLNGLLQGDVGSGKTVVAFALMLLAAKNGQQAALIAPTEVLATQHHEGFIKLAGTFGVSCALLTGQMKATEKKTALKGLKSGDVACVVGTHAVLEDTVEFNRLGLVIIDEQHRFGVEQRQKLLSRELVPDVLMMTATPIPRTLALALLGDTVSTYTLKQKPAGRLPIKSSIMRDDKAIFTLMYNELSKGHQCYVVCPLIDESEAESMQDVQSVEQEVERLRRVFARTPSITIEGLSGRMKADQMHDTLERFRDKKISILVSTTVVEVGVDVPNATVMVLRNAERFGLAQAHQLRGRVGRSDLQSYFVIDAPTENRRAQILASTDDGFVIAQEDMHLRGVGDFVGVGQSGDYADMQLLFAEPELYNKINKLNERLETDPNTVRHFALYLDHPRTKDKHIS